MRFRGLILTPDGTKWFETVAADAAERAVTIGTEAGETLLQRAGPSFIASLV